ESLPSQIGKLSALNTLYLNDNLLASLPQELFSLPIQYLYLHKNNFSDVPAGLQNLTDLRTLDLGNNRISRPAVGDLGRLRWLSLRANGIERLPESFVSAPQLAFLFLQDNRLTSLPARVGEFSQLSVLDASDNPLSELPGNFGNLKKLQSLRLERAAFTDMPATIAGLDSTNGGSLRELRLSGNPIPAEKRPQIQALVPKARIFW
ncbi:MAG: leucine-rich repeat domain-containing protein, partial [Bacteroidia bacterium]|nr:leucine-rich repeat domain-containing protein [Bacteroidia bacterium]